jgi:hypothetical protein
MEQFRLGRRHISVKKKGRNLRLSAITSWCTLLSPYCQITSVLPARNKMFPPGTCMCAKLCAPPGTGIIWSDMYYSAIISRAYMYLGGTFCSWLAIPVPSTKFRSMHYPAVNFRSVRRRHDRPGGTGSRQHMNMQPLRQRCIEKTLLTKNFRTSHVCTHVGDTCVVWHTRDVRATALLYT